MANKKFSQFNNITSLGSTGFLVGYDGVNNTRINLASIVSSLPYKQPNSDFLIDLASTSYTITQYGVYSIVNADNSGTNTIVLPPVNSLKGFYITIFNKDGQDAYFDTSNLPVDGSSGSAVDRVIGSKLATMYCDGEFWRVSYKNY